MCSGHRCVGTKPLAALARRRRSAPRRHRRREQPVIIAGFGRFGQIVCARAARHGHPIHRARDQPDAGRLRAPLRQQGLLRRRVAPGAAARGGRAAPSCSWCSRSTTWRLRSHRFGARALPALPSCARPQPPACVPALRSPGQRRVARDLRLEPGGRGDALVALGPPPAAARQACRPSARTIERTLLAQHAGQGGRGEDDRHDPGVSRAAAGEAVRGRSRPAPKAGAASVDEARSVRDFWFGQAAARRPQEL